MCGVCVGVVYVCVGVCVWVGVCGVCVWGGVCVWCVCVFGVCVCVCLVCVCVCVWCVCIMYPIMSTSEYTDWKLI